MGSWGTPTGVAAAAEGGIGPIVWVRRRNGSWWPGKIMEPDELAECNLTSPRTGTPVKLLGRDDASVDWYNLEKSKRVKPFRCGEFDDCIERAESAQGMPIKKREKYARREDAILHALELEKELLKKQGKLGIASDCPRKSSGSVKKELDAISEGLGHKSEKPGNAKSNHFSKIEVNIKDEVIGSPMHLLKAKDENQPIFEDDHSEATPRMRGLQDFGLRTTPLKRKISSSVELDGSGKPMADNLSQAPPSIVPGMEQTNHVNGEQQVGSISRAKRTRCVYLPAESSDSLDDKEFHPSQIKVLPSHFEDNECQSLPGALDEDNSSSGFMEDNESDSSESDSSELESDSSETEPDLDNEMTVFSNATAEQDGLRQPDAQEHGSTSSEEADESSDDLSNLYPDDPFLAGEAVSKWQLKGKRNIRHLTRKYGDDGKGFNGPFHRTYHRIKGSTLGQRAYGFDDPEFEDNHIGAQMVGLDNGGSLYTSRFSSKVGSSTSLDMIDWEDMTWEDRRSFKGQWGNRWERFNPMFVGHHHVSGRTRSVLVDVDLKVKASYQKERVPIVSLMSKLNGTAIIGHPIQIEVLEDGSSETLIPTIDYYSTDAVDHDGNTVLTPAWRTARRTNFRVPRPHLSSVLGVDVAEDFPSTDQGRRKPFRKSVVESISHKESPVRKNITHIPRPPMDRKVPRKLPKKVSLSSNQKTRTLSSIAVQQNFGVKPILDTYSQMDGIIKTETSGPTTVACIPVKLVFSRLLEKINRPPSKAASKVIVSNRDIERQL